MVQRLNMAINIPEMGVSNPIDRQTFLISQVIPPRVIVQECALILAARSDIGRTTHPTNAEPSQPIRRRMEDSAHRLSNA